MAILSNSPCPECQANGHDKTGNHLITFSDGAKLCTRAHFHKSGKQLYVAPDGKDPILDAELNGTQKFDAEQFMALQVAGKLDNEGVRALVLGGMREKDAYEVMSEEERKSIEEEWRLDMQHFASLPTKNLVSRHIKGEIAKFYGVKVGLGVDKKVARHYYPVSEQTEEGSKIIGAKCRELPKDFRKGLGKCWGKTELFGQQTLKQVLDSGRRMDTLVLVGGECDAMALQQVLVESQKGTKWEGVFFHIWSPLKGEACVKEILDNKDTIGKFKKIIVGFDADETGEALNKDVARLFRGRVKKLEYPAGFKDANACLMHGREKELVDAYFNPVEVFGGGSLKRVSDLAQAAKKTPEMGLSWPWPSMNPVTFGIQNYAMYVLGAGTGVGKTEGTKEICHFLMDEYDETVAVIYLEEPTTRTLRSYAGKLINKRIEDPQVNDPEDESYSKQRDYSKEQADKAIDELEERDRLIIVDTGGDKKIDNIMKAIDELVAMGVRYIVIDNLTAIELPKGGSKVEAIDEAMKQLGTFKDEKPVTLFVISHLTRPKDPRTPHERGGEVLITDFRGAGSITFWANGVFGFERDTGADTPELKSLTTVRAVKSRANGAAVGTCVRITMNPATGRILEPWQHPKSKELQTAKESKTESNQTKPSFATEEEEF